MTEGHGDDLYKYKDIRANFSSNVFTLTDNSSLMQHLQERLPALVQSYPEPEPYSLEAMLEEYYCLPSGSVMVTNGATEAIYLIAQYLSGREVSIAEPTFSEYRSACQNFGCDIAEESPIRWLCNPNNPTGLALTEEPEGYDLLVIDRSYEYFCCVPLPDLHLDGKHIYIYSLTKRYKIPGLRLGYIVASPELLVKIRSLRQPWSVNAIAIEAGKWIVENRFPEMLDRPKLWASTEGLSRALSQIKGVEVYPTDTHFMLIKTPFLASEVKERLANEYGILLRDASNFIGLSPYHLRIATQTLEANAALLSALSSLLGVKKY